MPIQSSNPFEIITLNDWAGVNQQAPRGSIADQEVFWDENFFVIGPGNLRSCWGPGPAVYTAPSGVQILRIFFGFIGNETAQFAAPPPGRLGWMFLSDGTIDQVDLDTAQVTHVGGADTQVWSPYAPQYWADAVVWRPQFFGNIAGQQGGVLFGSPKGLFGWDGTTLSKPGDPAPDWLTDALENTTIPFTMPVGLPGIYTMEIYNSRLFVTGKDVVSFSAPSNGADFSTTDGGGSFGYFGDKLTYTFNDLASSTGYLYVFGDSSTDLIADVQLSGTGTPESPFTTNLNYSNIDPQNGQRFPRAVGRIARYFQAFSGTSIMEVRGGEVREIGARINNLYATLNTSKFLPTMAPATMFGFHVLLCNVFVTDPFGVKRSLILMWHPGQPEFWSIASQRYNLTHIGAYEQDSTITPYGTDGTSLYQLFAAPDPMLPKRLSTKMYRGDGQKQLVVKNWKRLFLEFDDLAGSGVSFTGNLLTRGGVQGGVRDIGFELSPGAGYAFSPQATEGAGISGGVDLLSYSEDFLIERLHIGYEDRTLYGA